MRLDLVGPGKKAPEAVNVIIEIPAQSQPVKYELDKETGAMFVDRFLSTPMFYPCNYGYVPHTLSEDGDPVDVLVMTPLPVMTGAVIECRPIAVLNMSDENGPDAKLLAVPVNGLTPNYRDIQGIDDVCPNLLNAIKHFFEHYKDLEEGKWVKVDGWSGKDAAHEEIVGSIKRYEEAK